VFSLLISIIIFAFLGAWSADTHIRMFGKLPLPGKAFLMPARKQDMRAYVFFVVIGGIFFVSGIFTLSDNQGLKELLLESIRDISLVLVYISLLVNYIVRLKIYNDFNDNRHVSGRGYYIWEVIWSVKASQCKLNSDRRNLLLSNYAIVLFVLIYIVLIITRN